MKTKDQVLTLLKQNSNKYISGQEIADTLFLTRAGVWKAIKSLREAGFNIEAVNNRGYCLVTDNEMLSASLIESSLIKSSLPTDCDIKVITLDEVESTNDEARKYAVEGYNGNLLIASDYQTRGRGRRGREFYSPKGTGLYMSFLIHPRIEISKATKITCMAAVAVCRAIREVTGIEVLIKWVNDIFLNDLKIAGILTEGYTSMEDGSLSYVIVGIGINIYQPKEGFPQELKKIAGSLLPAASGTDIKNELCASITGHFFDILSSEGDYSCNDYVDEYRRRSNLIGNYVKILQANGRSSDKGYARVLEIDNDCRLVVSYDNGDTEALSTGEVSVVKY